jgi:3'-5' exoribonuclease
VIHRLRKLEDHEVDFADFFPCSERDPDEMFGELTQIIRSIENSHLRTLLELTFRDENVARLYKIAPAAKTIHHACRGGLLEHVLSLCSLARLAARHYSDLDLDLLLTGAVLHDIGKLEELSYDRSFGYSTEGQLLGHIVLSLRLVGQNVDRIPNFPAKLRTLIEHLIISHHGELEFGSPKIPLFPEALLLHLLDNLDSKMNAMRTILKRDSRGEGEFTGWVASLERVLLRKDVFLREAPPEPAKTVTIKPEEAKPEETIAAEPLAAPKTTAAPLAERRPEPQRQPMNTLFGEKLQAVLDERK